MPKVKTISPDDSQHIKWFLQNERHALNEDGISPTIRILINKVNELTDVVNELQDLKSHTPCGRDGCLSRKKKIINP